MNKRKNQRRQIFANKFHKQIFLLVVLAALLPTAIVTVCLYYLIFGVTSMQLGIPEAIAYNIIPASEKVTIILLSLAPAVIVILLIFAHKITHTIVGPFDRIVRELDDYMQGGKKTHISLRKTDKFHPLVNRINKLLDKIN